MITRRKYEASCDGINWVEVGCPSTQRYSRVTTWDLSELDEAKEKIQELEKKLAVAQKEAADARAYICNRGYQRGLGYY